MKAIISSTYDDNYLYFIPIVTWCWNKLSVGVICFLPYLSTEDENKKIDLINDTFRGINIKPQYAGFSAPKHKEATYAQCSRLYASCLELPQDEILVTSDVDMAVINFPFDYMPGFTVIGSDLVPKGQYPICYIGATQNNWEFIFRRDLERKKTYQKCLDDLLGGIEAQHFKGNYWSKDQEEAHLIISTSIINTNLIPRSNGQNQFATKRYDRDDAYLLERLNPDTIDFHMPRPGYEDKNFDIILKVLQYHYPQEDFTWLIDYTNKYKQLL